MNTTRTNFSESIPSYRLGAQTQTQTQTTMTNTDQQEPADEAATSKSNTKLLSRSKSTVEHAKIVPLDNRNSIDEWKKHATEAGINVSFPGISEQKYRYQRPVKPEYKNFVVNPQPDLARFDRPFTIAACYPLSTEYGSKFEYPNANKIDKFPWIKQF